MSQRPQLPGRAGRGLPLPRLVGYMPQLDELKGLAILAVLALHALPVHALFDAWTQLHIGQAVPVFAILMGLNAFASSARRSAGSLRTEYTRRYVVGRIDRLWVPFVLIFVVGLAAAMVRGDLRLGSLAGLVTGELPTSGPGNYFIGLAFQFAVLGPALCIAYRRRPRLTLVTAFVVSALFDLVASHVPLFDARPYFYASAVIRFAPFIVLGMALADAMLREASLPRWWSAAALISVIYIVMVCINHDVLPLATDDWRPWAQTFLASFFPALLVVVGVQFLPTRGSLTGLLAPLGRASYHIFLVQILWFAAVETRSVAILPLDLVACCALGHAFWRLTARIPSVASPQGPAALSREAPGKLSA